MSCLRGHRGHGWTWSCAESPTCCSGRRPRTDSDIQWDVRVHVGPSPPRPHPHPPRHVCSRGASCAPVSGSRRFSDPVTSSSHGVVFGRPFCPGSWSSSSSRGLHLGAAATFRTRRPRGRETRAGVPSRRVGGHQADGAAPGRDPCSCHFGRRSASQPQVSCQGGTRRVTAPVPTARHQVGGRARPVPFRGARSPPR